MSVHLSRRALVAGLCLGPAAAGASSAGSRIADIRGTFDPGEAVRPNAGRDQSAALRDALVRAEATGRPVFMPPGRYEIAEIDLTPSAHIIGIPGETRLVFGGGRHMLRAAHTRRCRLQGLSIEGGDRPLGGDVKALVDCRDVGDLAIDDCDVAASAGAGIALTGCAGRIEGTRVGAVRAAGIDLVDSRGLTVAGNVVADCGDGGILVQRLDAGADDTIVRGNRVSRIRARSGGTGQHGNGINLAKANGVVVADNRVDDCDFSAIRCFSSDNLQVTGNILTRSGETALYVEFAFEGAIVANNLVDDAAVGISFANFLEYGGRLGTCSGNVVRNIRGHTRLPNGGEPSGAGISAEADMAITGNVVENAWLGLQLGWGPYLRDVTATGNTIRRVRIGIAVSVVEGAGAALVANNLVSGATQGGILGMRWADAVTPDLAAAAAGAFPHLTIAANRVS
ncbi:TIGR03808 family TAT-translocated repetitive protein [Propylenella binzhouense]|nr:TIGR03808 family TAT-translocated repetitive protein [Propylenella binzhouense]